MPSKKTRWILLQFQNPIERLGLHLVCDDLFIQSRIPLRIAGSQGHVSLIPGKWGNTEFETLLLIQRAAPRFLRSDHWVIV